MDRENKILKTILDFISVAIDILVKVGTPTPRLHSFGLEFVFGDFFSRLKKNTKKLKQKERIRFG